MPRASLTARRDPPDPLPKLPAGDCARTHTHTGTHAHARTSDRVHWAGAGLVLEPLLPQRSIGRGERLGERRLLRQRRQLPCVLHAILVHVDPDEPAALAPHLSSLVEDAKHKGHRGLGGGKEGRGGARGRPARQAGARCPSKSACNCCSPKLLVRAVLLRSHLTSTTSSCAVEAGSTGSMTHCQEKGSSRGTSARTTPDSSPRFGQNTTT